MRTNPNLIRSVARKTDTLAVGLAIRNERELALLRLSTVSSERQVGWQNADGHSERGGILSDGAGRKRNSADDSGNMLAVTGDPSRWESGERSFGYRSFQSR